MESEQTLDTRPLRVSKKAGLLAGMLAGLLATALLVALRFTVDAPGLPDVMADWLTMVMPAVLFDFVLERLQVASKPLMFAGLLVGQVVAGAIFGLLYARYSPVLPLQESSGWARGVLMGTALWLVLMVVISPVIGAGLFGTGLLYGTSGYFFSTFLSAATYGITLTHVHYMALTRAQGPQELGRREFIQRAAFATFLVAVGGFAARSIFRGASDISPSRVRIIEGELPPEITPNADFYEVSKNIIDPRVDVVGWSLKVDGDGMSNPFKLSYDELQELPWKEQYTTLTCISNRVGGPLISNALWRGVELKVLLERAGLAPGVEKLAFHGADGYVDSFPLEWAMRDNVLVAYRMNGDRLADEHGFPARIIVPGLYGMENVKWLTRIAPVAADFRGYWQVRGWADTAIIKTSSRVDVPRDRAVLPTSEIPVGGVAFAGDRGVSSVEFSPDGGRTWLPAELRPALSPYTWVLWTGGWTPPGSQRNTIRVRATDGTGDVQTADVKQSLPDGATGHHIIVVSVVESDPPAG